MSCSPAAAPLVLLGFFLLAQPILGILFFPLKVIGKQSLFAFNFHIIFIWVAYRYLLGLRHNVTYTQALWLTAVVFVGACVGAALKSRRQNSLRHPKKRPHDGSAQKQEQRPRQNTQRSLA
ncbi:MAG: hypothetical protein R3C68_01280 [Myxococcota bacterium]